MLVILDRYAAIDTDLDGIIKTHCVVSSSYSKEVWVRSRISTEAFVRWVLRNAGYDWDLDRVDFTDSTGRPMPINDTLTMGEAASDYYILGEKVYINLKPGAGA